MRINITMRSLWLSSKRQKVEYHQERNWKNDQCQAHKNITLLNCDRSDWVGRVIVQHLGCSHWLQIQGHTGRTQEGNPVSSNICTTTFRWDTLSRFARDVLAGELIRHHLKTVFFGGFVGTPRLRRVIPDHRSGVLSGLNGEFHSPYDKNRGHAKHNHKPYLVEKFNWHLRSFLPSDWYSYFI